MLQDLEAGRPMELEAVVGAVVELGDRLGVPMPATRAVYACAKLLDEHTTTQRAANRLAAVEHREHATTAGSSSVRRSSR